ncbi:MAG: ABC transporter ATP-binding protein [Thermomicrobiales bacterium]
MAGTGIVLSHLSKRYGDLTVVDDVSLEIEPGEFLVLLGPSGSGKTTILRMIAGFLDVSEGDILIGGRSVRNVPAYDRDIGVVFQNYALFPHMSVLDNVAFGLRMRKMAKQERYEQARQMLALVDLAQHANRYPSQLSGGEQQRVALARALAIKPRVLLMDEPLGALDRKLRLSVREEITAIQRNLGITTVFVTHDQEEALTMADRIVILRQGLVEDIGTPSAIYERPANRFVAGFIGNINFLTGLARSGTSSGTVVELPEIGISCQIDGVALDAGQSVTIGIRPERLALDPGPDRQHRFQARVEGTTYLGDILYYQLRTPAGHNLMATRLSGNAGGSFRTGETVTVGWRDGDAVALTA